MDCWGSNSERRKYPRGQELTGASAAKTIVHLLDVNALTTISEYDLCLLRTLQERELEITQVWRHDDEPLKRGYQL